MARDENPPFKRGEFAPVGDDGSLAFPYLEGREYLFEDNDPRSTSGSSASRTGRMVRCRLVRNVSGAALLPKRLVTFQATAGRYGARVDGYADTTAEHCYPVDEYLPASGVPNNGLFYIVVEGPAVVLTDIAASANNVITVGMNLISLTAATSGATTAGRVSPIGIDAGTTANSTNADRIVNRLGRALTARTTGNTNSDVLVDIGKW